jgi:hypothetical protein
VKEDAENIPVGSLLAKRMLNALGDAEKNIERIAFERDPTQNRDYQSVYMMKTRLLPDALLKRVAIQDDLVASILLARSNMLSAFGLPQPDRFSYGFKIEPNRGVLDDADDEAKEELQERIAEVTKKLLTCGGKILGNDGHDNRCALKEFMYVQARNALLFGRFATEVIWKHDSDNERKFHAFRPIDAGSVFRATNQTKAVEKIREEAKKLLAGMKGQDGEPIDQVKWGSDEYRHVQVFDGRPMVAFTDEECVVTNCYPVTDYELQGYPLTPLDTVIAAVTTHINITNHNKLYFQSGRASRGMLVIKSADVDEGVVARIRGQFNASINSVNNSWRMPVFAVSPDDDVQWQPIDSGGRDMEFQYLSDTNARVILSAFQMSPEELPGYSHLSRGTNSQALSESNNEYKLEAHRDVGIRPLLAHFENFLNDTILPLLDPKLAAKATLKLVGLDAETSEKESVRLQQDMPIHMNLDEVYEKVEKDPIGKEWGGRFPLNPQWAAVIDKYIPVGLIMEHFFGMTGMSKNPRFQYLRDPFYFQQLNQEMQEAQMKMQAQQPPPQPEGGGDDDEGGGDDKKDGEKTEKKEEGDDLTRSIDQAIEGLGKSEQQLPVSKRRLLAQHRVTVKAMMDGWEADSLAGLAAIADVATKHAPTQRAR